MYTTLFSDVDKTILTSNYDLPLRVVEGLRLARANGIEVVLATARSPMGVAPICRALSIKHAICFNGAWVGEPIAGSVLSKTMITREVALSIMGDARQLGLTALWYATDAVYAVEETLIAHHETNITGESLTISENIFGFPGRPCKIMCVRSDEKDNAFEIIRERFSANCEISASNSRLLEITPKGISKGAAANLFASEKMLEANSCAAVGDGENDISLLRWAGIPLTVANAIPDVLTMAAFSGPSCEEGGLAEVLAWLISHNNNTS